MADPAREAAREMEQLLQAAVVPVSEGGLFSLAGRHLQPAQIVDLLQPFLTPARQARIDAVLDGRTYTVVPVVEGLINVGNVSAVMRTAEALGFQAFHVIRRADDAFWKASDRTTQGAEKWLDVWTWPTPEACARRLKEEGYQIIATHLDAEADPLDEVDFTQKTALVFGNERDGVSPGLLALSDRRCIVPMQGFTRSFNISVAAAVCLYHAYRDRLRRQSHHGDLTASQRAILRAHYYLKSVKHARKLLAETLDRQERSRL